MTSIDYWLSETVVARPMPVSYVMHPELQFYFGRTPHSFSAPEMANVFKRLLDVGDITIGNEPLPTLMPELPTTVAEWEAFFMHQEVQRLPNQFTLSYSLTPQGGIAWEKMVAPRWDDYVLHRVATELSNNPQQTVMMFFAANNREKIEELLDFYNVDAPEDEQWKTRAPWKAFYWKEFPVGYELACPIPHESVSLPFIKNRQEYTSRFKNWYTPPKM